MKFFRSKVRKVIILITQLKSLIINLDLRDMFSLFLRKKLNLITAFVESNSTEVPMTDKHTIKHCLTKTYFARIKCCEIRAEVRVCGGVQPSVWLGQ